MPNQYMMSELEENASSALPVIARFDSRQWITGFLTMSTFPDFGGALDVLAEVEAGCHGGIVTNILSSGSHSCGEESTAVADWLVVKSACPLPLMGWLATFGS